jgi:hypothetical protein
MRASSLFKTVWVPVALLSASALAGAQAARGRCRGPSTRVTVAAGEAVIQT